MIKYIKQFFCIHDWLQTNKDPLLERAASRSLCTWESHFECVDCYKKKKYVRVERGYLIKGMKEIEKLRVRSEKIKKILNK
jgi:hypothetical protein